MRFPGEAGTAHWHRRRVRRQQMWNEPKRNCTTSSPGRSALGAHGGLDYIPVFLEFNQFGGGRKLSFYWSRKPPPTSDGSRSKSTVGPLTQGGAARRKRLVSVAVRLQVQLKYKLPSLSPVLHTANESTRRKQYGFQEPLVLWVATADRNLCGCTRGGATVESSHHHEETGKRIDRCGFRGPLGAHLRNLRELRNRLPPGTGRPDRVCPLVRAHDVRRYSERSEGCAQHSD
jgi:hypothetical protein